MINMEVLADLNTNNVKNATIGTSFLSSKHSLRQEPATQNTEKAIIFPFIFSFSVFKVTSPILCTDCMRLKGGRHEEFFYEGQLSDLVCKQLLPWPLAQWSHQDNN